MTKELPKQYNPEEVEDKIYKFWKKNGYFKPEINREDDPFTIMMPPPNVTGILHMGHAMFVTLEDLIIRFRRMQGRAALWLPGTDHAGIATQNVVEKELEKKGKKRTDLTRKEFIDQIWKWKGEHGDRIEKQIKTLGASADWSRKKFTLDPDLSAAVTEAFVRLYEKGLIYQGVYIVNFCPKCGTAVSDDEVEHVPEKTTLFYFKYDKNFPVTIATTRPETKLGDTAVAVDPGDRRYKKFIDKTFKIDLDGIKREIKIISDKSIDKDFGTGALGVTPAHSMGDWRLAEDNNLKIIKVIDEKGRMTEEAGKYQRLKVIEAQKKLIEHLKKNNLLEKEEEIEHNLSICYRCEEAIEPLPSKQWFVKMKPLAKPALEAMKSGKIKIIPKHFEKIYYHWLKNIRDWCISRQLVWGHQIPVWYKQVSELKVKSEKLKVDDNSGNIYVGTKPPNTGEWKKDPDVLDTWFSSALWPISTLGWPNEKAADFKKFYPTDVLETGYDILFFWVARMIMFGLFFTNKPPFKTVYLHGLVRDERGRKMSKSLGNIIDPIKVSKEFGTDALRYSTVVGTSAGKDINLSIDKIKGNRNFSNKIWNASRFVIMNLTPPSHSDPRSKSGGKNPVWAEKDLEEIDIKNLDKEHKKKIKDFEEHKKKITKYLEKFQFSLAGESLRDFFWHTFCDKCLEEEKDKLKLDGEKAKISKKYLLYLLCQQLKMLHPFMPFITEEIWQNIISELDLKVKPLIISKWPE